MKTKLTKEIFQQLIIRAKGTLAKGIAQSLKNNKFVEVFYDDTLKSQMVFGNDPEGLVKFDPTKGHHLAKVSHIHPKSFKQDIYELETSHIIIPCEELIAPTYKKITVKDILNLPRKESDLSLHTLAEDILPNDSWDYVDNPYKITSPEIKISTVLEYSQGDSGKYGQIISVITFQGEDVALISAHGKWTDTYTITPISDNYNKMVIYLDDLFINKDCKEVALSLEDEYDMVTELEEMFLNKEYTKHVGE